MRREATIEAPTPERGRPPGAGGRSEGAPRERRADSDRVVGTSAGREAAHDRGDLGLTSFGHVSDLVKRRGAELARDHHLRKLAGRCRELIRALPPPAFSPPGLQPTFAR
jgi:hypothetical protein